MSNHHDSALSHVSGHSIFLEDTGSHQGELYLSVVTSKIACGEILNINYQEALKLSDKIYVFSAKDFTHNFWGPIEEDQPILADKKVSYLGQAILLVASPNQSLSHKAASMIQIEYSRLDPCLKISEAKIKRDFLSEKNSISRGQADQAIAQSDHTITGSLFSKGQDHFYLESQSSIAYPGEDHDILIHSSSQHPSEIQHTVAHCLGLSLNQVVCVVKRMGGGFGGKESQATQYALFAALVAHKTSRIARLHLTKDEDMVSTGKRHPFLSEYHVGFDHLGKICGLEVDLASDGGAFLDLSCPVLQRAMLHIDNAYYIPHLRVSGQVCRTNLPPNTAFRGFGGPQGVAVIESIIEDIACYLKLDPLQVRLANLYSEKRGLTTHYGQAIENNMLPLLFDRIEKTSNYRERKKEIDLHNSSNQSTIRGISIVPVKFGISFTVKYLNQANALVNIHLDGTVQVSTGATEMGQGVNVKIAQIVGETLGISLSKIKMMPTSTEKNHNTSATAASSGTDLNGSAAENAAKILRSRLAEFAAYYLSYTDEDRPDPILDNYEYNTMAKFKPDQVCFEENNIFIRSNPNNKVSFGQIVHAAYLHRVNLGSYGFYKTPGIFFDKRIGQGNPFLYFTMGVACSEVIIDRFTGDYKVSQTDILMDLGRPINDGIDHGQIAGAFVQGMGWVTGEDLRYSSEGELMTHSPTTYKIPSIHDTPRKFHIDLIENDASTKSLRGSKAVGEPPFLLSLSVWTAIKNALQSYKGSSCSELSIPASNEDVFRILHNLELNHES